MGISCRAGVVSLVYEKVIKKIWIAFVQINDSWATNLKTKMKRYSVHEMKNHLKEMLRRFEFANICISFSLALHFRKSNVFICDVILVLIQIFLEPALVSCFCISMIKPVFILHACINQFQTNVSFHTP